jgi:putative membrane protein
MPHVFMPLLHSGDGYPEGFLHSAWQIPPSVAFGVFGLISAYVVWTGPLNRRRPGSDQRPVTGKQTAAFVAGCLALLMVLGPPLDDWSDNYLLSAHMIQHMILMLVVAPLWLVGLPGWIFAPISRKPLVDRLGWILTRPPITFLIANAVIVIWHFPAMYDLALRSEPVHIAQHLSFLAAWLFAWWPILGQNPAWPRLAQLPQCLYLFLLAIPGGIVGAFITFAEPGLYEAYTVAPRLWGISLATDQQIGGLLMWVVENLIFLLIITAIFFSWAGREDRTARGEFADAGSRGRLQSVSRQP